MKRIAYLVFSAFLFYSCKKDASKQQPTIDISEQWTIDGLGNLIFGYADGQWQTKTFTSPELALFSSMDTANLTGTTKPGVVLENTLNYNSTYPNPFVSSGGHRLHFEFTSGYSGQLILKMVYVDSLMIPRFKIATRFQSNALPPPVPSAIEIAIHPSLPSPGRYRLYYTLSAQGNPHFYKSWGNVQEAQ